MIQFVHQQPSDILVVAESYPLLRQEVHNLTEKYGPYKCAQVGDPTAHESEEGAWTFVQHLIIFTPLSEDAGIEAKQEIAWTKEDVRFARELEAA